MKTKSRKKIEKPLSSREFSRKYQTAVKAVNDALDHTLRQIFNDWDRDEESTYAYLSAVNHSLAYTVGALLGELQRRSIDMDVVLQANATLSHEGFHTNFLKTFRKKRKPKSIVDNVIALPVVRR